MCALLINLLEAILEKIRLVKPLDNPYHPDLPQDP